MIIFSIASNIGHFPDISYWYEYIVAKNVAFPVFSKYLFLIQYVAGEISPVSFNVHLRYAQDKKVPNLIILGNWVYGIDRVYGAQCVS